MDIDIIVTVTSAVAALWVGPPVLIKALTWATTWKR